MVHEFWDTVIRIDQQATKLNFIRSKLFLFGERLEDA